MTRRAVVRSAALSGLMLAAAWLAGFAWFVHGAVQAGSAGDRADGIVVLTGGADRVATGARLLQQGRGRVMLISGVGHGAEFAALLRGTGIDPAPLATRVTLGRAATSTTGNADETAAWVADEDLRSLLVVTAGYHMQRALTELQRRLPAVRLTPVPVLPPALRNGGTLAALRLPMLRLLANEYTKLIVSTLGLARLGAEAGHEPG